MKIECVKIVNKNAMIMCLIKRYKKIDTKLANWARKLMGLTRKYKHLNGTVTIELKPGISERINIRRIIPYKE
jgi:hypothetical protein